MSEDRAKLWAEFLNGVGLVTASALLIATVLILARIFHVYQPPGILEIVPRIGAVERFVA